MYVHRIATTVHGIGLFTYIGSRLARTLRDRVTLLEEMSDTQQCVEQVSTLSPILFGVACDVFFEQIPVYM